uniref:Uncharacterized protein n=1 Tax=Corethron hystrix TaxID=216773 RepID=A0A7S1FUM5_9STRA|mmetsp:Transcript_32448/g.74699  ORF Transcript_32448/g.74699 Transcript_32448/m.74699 type:complete len:515 (+) Transcript_32448:174-1718(+)
MFSVTFIVALAILFAFGPTHASTVISDFRVRDRDVTPALGRGFSIATGEILATCWEEVTQNEPTYDYDYTLKDFQNEDGDFDYAGTRNVAKANFLIASAHAEANAEHDSRTDTKTHSIMGVLTVDRYHSSLDENGSELSMAAKELIKRDEFIGFFKTCGPGFIRSLRRQAMMMAMFDYESTENTSNTNVYMKLSANDPIRAASVEGNFTEKKNQLMQSLKITIRATGIGLLGGEGSLTPRTMEQYSETMDYVFKSIQRSDVGNVVSVEVVSYINSPNFQVLTEVSRTMEYTVCYDSVDVDSRNILPCEDENVVFHVMTINSMVRKFNVVSNAEHVVRIQSIVTSAMTRLELIQQCINKLTVLPAAVRNLNLKNHKCMKNYLGTNCEDRTVQQLLDDLVGLDQGTYYYSREAIRLRNYVDNYFNSCIIDLNRNLYGIAGGTFQARHWTQIPSCNKIACTYASAFWDSAIGNCVVRYDQVALRQDLSRHATAQLFCMPMLENDEKYKKTKCVLWRC